MHIGAVARAAGVTVKAVRYYEQLGLVAPHRLPNGYREYDAAAVAAVREVRALALLGIGPTRSRPFLDCLAAGHQHGDDCPASLATYRDTILELERSIGALTARREALLLRLHEGAGRGTAPRAEAAPRLPPGLPVPPDDGAAAHLPGRRVPALVLPASDGREVSLHALGPGRSIVYCYPLTGQPGTDLPEGWDTIPGARGCTTQACDVRDHFTELRAAGVNAVFGLSSQPAAYQAELVHRLALPFAMLSDPDFVVAQALRLPSFAAPGHKRLYTRLTLVLRDGVIEHVFYPIFPPNEHAGQLLSWLAAH